MFPNLITNIRQSKMMSEYRRLKAEAKQAMQKGDLKLYFNKLIEVENFEKQIYSFQMN